LAPRAALAVPGSLILVARAIWKAMRRAATWAQGR